MAEPRATGPHAPECTQLLAPVRVAESQAVTAGLATTRAVSPSSTASTSQSRPSSVTSVPGRGSLARTSGCARSIPAPFTVTISYSSATRSGYRAWMELGVYTFAELRADPASGNAVDPAQRLRDLMEEIELADQVGLDVFGVGEHHRPDFAVSVPGRRPRRGGGRVPKRIRLTSAVTVLSSDDPVRVFQDFATVDLLSGGRAEIMAGRGSFIESFPLFGYDLADYDELFAEKLALLLDCASPSA